MNNLETKKERISKIIEEFKKSHPDVKPGDIDSLVNFFASSCMQMIVDNQERTGYADRAWWSIKDAFEIEIDDESLMLPINRNTNDVIQSKFDEACSNGDIEGIKEGLQSFASINRDAYSGVLTDAVMMGNLKTFQFFIEDDFINKNDFYRTQVDFKNQKGELFSTAYYYDQTQILEYLINEHDAEFTEKAKEILNKDGDYNNNNDHKKKKKTIMSIIEKKHMSFMLEFSLDDKTTNNKKLKV